MSLHSTFAELGLCHIENYIKYREDVVLLTLTVKIFVFNVQCSGYSLINM